MAKSARYLVTTRSGTYTTSTLAEAKAVERAGGVPPKRKRSAKRRNPRSDEMFVPRGGLIAFAERMDKLADTDFRAYHSIVMQAAEIIGEDEVERITRGNGLSGATSAQLFSVIMAAQRVVRRELSPRKNPAKRRRNPRASLRSAPVLLMPYDKPHGRLLGRDIEVGTASSAEGALKVAAKAGWVTFDQFGQPASARSVEVLPMLGEKDAWLIGGYRATSNPAKRRNPSAAEHEAAFQLEHRRAEAVRKAVRAGAYVVESTGEMVAPNAKAKAALVEADRLYRQLHQRFPWYHDTWYFKNPSAEEVGHAVGKYGAKGAAAVGRGLAAVGRGLWSATKGAAKGVQAAAAEAAAKREAAAKAAAEAQKAEVKLEQKVAALPAPAAPVANPRKRRKARR